MLSVVLLLLLLSVQLIYWLGLCPRVISIVIIIKFVMASICTRV